MIQPKVCCQAGTVVSSSGILLKGYGGENCYWEMEWVGVETFPLRRLSRRPFSTKCPLPQAPRMPPTWKAVTRPLKSKIAYARTQSTLRGKEGLSLCACANQTFANTWDWAKATMCPTHDESQGKGGVPTWKGPALHSPLPVSPPPRGLLQI